MAKKVKEKRKHDLESFLGFGWYQIYHYLMQNLKVICQMSNMSFMVYGGAFPKLSCDPTETSGIYKNETEGMDRKEICKLWTNGLCSNLSMEIDFNSIASEWGLVCDKAYLVYMASSVQMAGVLVGAPTFGQLSDLFGRKKISIFCLVAMLLLGGTSSQSPNIQAFVAFRFFIGFFTGGIITTSYVFLIEFIKQKHRLILMAIGGWPLAYMLFGLMGYVTADWRKLAILGNCLGIPVLVMLGFTKESPKWLIQRGRLDEAREIYIQLAKWNRRTIDLDDLTETIEIERQKLLQRRMKRPTFWHLFYSWGFVKHTAALALAWFSVSCVSYGLLFNMEKLSGSRYLNMLYFGFIRLAVATGTAAAELLIKRCGRKTFHFVGGGVISLCCAVIFVITASGAHKTEPGAIRALCLAAACMTSTLWMVVYLMAAEVYPTPIRNLANSFCSVCARVGGILAPQVIFLSHTWEPGPFLIFTILIAADIAIFQLLLPETKGKPLPDHMPDRNQRIFRKKTKAHESKDIDNDNSDIHMPLAQMD